MQGGLPETDVLEDKAAKPTIIYTNVTSHPFPHISGYGIPFNIQSCIGHRTDKTS